MYDASEAFWALKKKYYWDKVTTDPDGRRRPVRAFGCFLRLLIRASFFPDKCILLHNKWTKKIEKVIS